MARPLELDDLYTFERVSDASLHPDGTAVAYAVAVADRESDTTHSRIWLGPLDDEEPRPYSAGPRDSAPRWSPDGQWLGFIRQPDSAPPQLWVLPTRGGDAALVDAGPVLDYAWAPDSDTFAVVRLVDLRGEPDDQIAAERHRNEPVVVERLGFKADGAGLIGTRRAHLFVVPRAGGEARQLTDGDASVAAPAWSPDGRRVAVVTATHDTRDVDAVSHVAVIDAAGGELRLVTDWYGIAAWIRWLSDEQLLVAGVDRVDTARHTSLFTVSADGGKPEPLLHDFDRNVMTGNPGYPRAAPQIAGDLLLFAARDRGTVHLYAAPLAGGSARKLVGGDDRLVSGCSVVGQRVVYVLATPNSPGEVVIRDLAGGDERRLTRHNGFLDDVIIHRATSRTFTTPQGDTVHGRVMHDGRARGPRPLLLDIHGGPHNAWGPVLDDVHLYQQHLVARGWLVLTLNTVGSDGYGQDWYAGLRGGWGHKDEEQFLGAVDALIAEGLVDPDRLAVTGYSYGGYMTNWLLSRTDRFAAAITGGCVANLISFYGTADLGRLLLSCELGVELPDGRDRYTDLSPLTRAATVTTPTLIVHGEEDHRCPVGQAEEWFTALRQRGVASRLVRYPGAGHLFILTGRPSHRLHYNEQIVAWALEHTG